MVGVGILVDGIVVPKAGWQDGGMAWRDVCPMLVRLGCDMAGGIICGDDCEWYFEQLDSDFVYQHKDKDIGSDKVEGVGL